MFQIRTMLQNGTEPRGLSHSPSSKIFDGTRAPALSDEDALAIAKEATRPYTPTQLKSLPRDERDAYLRALQAGGIGISQASRITGLGKSTVHRAYHA